MFFGKLIVIVQISSILIEVMNFVVPCRSWRRGGGGGDFTLRLENRLLSTCVYAFPKFISLYLKTTKSSLSYGLLCDHNHHDLVGTSTTFLVVETWVVNFKALGSLLKCFLSHDFTPQCFTSISQWPNVPPLCHLLLHSPPSPPFNCDHHLLMSSIDEIDTYTPCPKYWKQKAWTSWLLCLNLDIVAWPHHKSIHSKVGTEASTCMDAIFCLHISFVSPCLAITMSCLLPSTTFIASLSPPIPNLIHHHQTTSWPHLPLVKVIHLLLS